MDREHDGSASLALWVGTSHPIGATLAIPIQTSFKTRGLYGYSQKQRLKFQWAECPPVSIVSRWCAFVK
jgi:hypothetical protein